MSALLGPAPQLTLPFQEEAPETDERFTPWPLFSRLHGEFGFSIDVAACVTAAKLPGFCTREQNGLPKSWRDRQVSESWKLTTRILPKRTHIGTPEDPDAKRRGRPECGLVTLIWETSAC